MVQRAALIQILSAFKTVATQTPAIVAYIPQPGFGWKGALRMP